MRYQQFYIVPFTHHIIILDENYKSIYYYGSYPNFKLGVSFERYSLEKIEDYIHNNYSFKKEITIWLKNKLYKNIDLLAEEQKMDMQMSTIQGNIMYGSQTIIEKQYDKKGEEKMEYETKDIEIGKAYNVGYIDRIVFPIEKDDKTFTYIKLNPYGTSKNNREYINNIREEFNISFAFPEENEEEKKLKKAIKNLKLFYIEYENIINFTGSDFNIKPLALIDDLSFNAIMIHIKTAYEKRKNILKKGQNNVVKNVILEEYEPEVVIETKGDNITEKYASIVSNISEVTKDINKNTALLNHKEIAESFVKAKESLSKLTEVKPNRFGYIGKWLTDNKILKATVDDLKKEKEKNKSTQENIDYLFGVVYEKYESLISTGEGLQKSKLQMSKQIELLEELKKSSDEELSHYKNNSEIPIRDLAINTQIKSSIEKYKQRLTKIDGAIVATQTTITSLAKDLPAMKNDLTDEMAISTLLGSVDDYQVMYQEIAGLVSEVTTATAEKTHTVIENLLDLQINDTNTMDYLISSGQRAEKLATMLTDKTGKLSKKVLKDAEFISDIANNKVIENASKKIKFLN